VARGDERKVDHDDPRDANSHFRQKLKKRAAWREASLRFSENRAARSNRAEGALGPNQ
jgi:hypothetical protein